MPATKRVVAIITGVSASAEAELPMIATIRQPYKVFCQLMRWANAAVRMAVMATPVISADAVSPAC